MGIEWTEIDGKCYVLHSWTLDSYGDKEYKWVDADALVRDGLIARRQLAGWPSCAP